MPIQKSEIQSGIATAIISVIILIVLLVCGMTAHSNEMDEGVMVSFGDAVEGFGEQPMSAVSVIPAAAPKTASSASMPDEDLMTQDEEQSVALDEEQERRRREEAQRLEEERRMREDAERAAEEQRQREAEAARIAAERAAKADAVKSLAGNAFSKTGGGQGETTGESMKGNPAGHGSSGGNTWSLSGRNMVGRFYKPTYSSNEEGRIVISIRVDDKGNVTSATIANGTTISDHALREASLEAAKRNKFTGGNGVAIGTITYNFVLN